MLTWPAVLQPVGGGFWIENAERGGGIAWDGSEQTVFSMAQRWRARLSLLIRSVEEADEAYAMFARLDGRANAIAVPATRFPNWPVDGEGRSLPPSATVKRRPDGQVLAGEPTIPEESRIVASVVQDAALRATEVIVAITQGSPARRGQVFSLGTRLYRIVDVTLATGSVQTLVIRPPLRVATAMGAAVNFQRPVCAMKQANADQCLKELEMFRFADLTLEFVESVDVA